MQQNIRIKTSTGNGSCYTKYSTETMRWKEPIKSVNDLKDITREKRSGEGKVIPIARLSPEKLYDAPYETDEEKPAILRIRNIIHEAIGLLENALERYDDEIEKEDRMTLFTNTVFKLIAFIKINKNLKDAICMLHIITNDKIKDVYSKREIKSLKEVLGVIRDNIYMSEDILDRCYDTLEDAGFDLNAPFSDIGFE